MLLDIINLVYYTCKEWCLLNIDLAKLGFNMFPGQNLKMFVNDLAPHELIPVEVAYHIFRFLSCLKELLLIIKLCIFPMALKEMRREYITSHSPST